MSVSIANYEFEVSNRFQRKLAAYVCRFAFACAFLCIFGGNLFAQNVSEGEIREQAERLNSSDIETRRDALHRLRTAKSEEASRIAAGGLDDKTEIVRATAPYSVLALPTDEAVENLLPHLRDKSEFVRRETAYALGRTRSMRAVKPLIETLRTDKQYQVRCSAAVALGEIGELPAVYELMAILQKNPKEDEDFLRRAAAHSLGQIAEFTLLREFTTQSEIKTSDVFVSENRKTLTAKFPVLRSTVPVLIQVLQNQKESDDVKRESAYALGALGDASAVPVLQSKLVAEDYYLAENARQALQKVSAASNP